MMNAFQNLNKIDSIIKDSYPNTDFIFNESASDYKFIIENNGVELVLKFDREDFPNYLLPHNEKVNWSYLTDPSDSSSSIKRSSTYTSLINHINDIFDKSMFKESYLSKITTNDKLIVENSNNVVSLIDEKEDTIIVNRALLEAKFNEYGIVTDFELEEVRSIDGVEAYEIKSDLESKAYNGNLDISTLVKLESELSDFFDLVLFNTHLYKVTLEIEYKGKEVILE